MNIILAIFQDIKFFKSTITNFFKHFYFKNHSQKS